MTRSWAVAVVGALLLAGCGEGTAAPSGSAAVASPLDASPGSTTTASQATTTTPAAPLHPTGADTTIAAGVDAFVDAVADRTFVLLPSGSDTAIDRPYISFRDPNDPQLPFEGWTGCMGFFGQGTWRERDDGGVVFEGQASYSPPGCDLADGGDGTFQLVSNKSETAFDAVDDALLITVQGSTTRLVAVDALPIPSLEQLDGRWAAGHGETLLVDRSRSRLLLGDCQATARLDAAHLDTDGWTGPDCHGTELSLMRVFDVSETEQSINHVHLADGMLLIDSHSAKRRPIIFVLAAVGADRIAGWPTAPERRVPLDEVPLLLPSERPATGEPVRFTVEGGSAAPAVFTQVFADAKRDIVFTIQTQPGGVESTPVADRRPVVIDGWADAFLTTGSWVRLVASDSSGYLRLMGTGLDGDEAVSIVAGLRGRPDGAAGWDLATTSTGFVEINGAWEDSAAQRFVTWYDGDQAIAEMLSSPAYTHLIAQALDSSFDQVDVNGRVGWLSAGSRSSIVWSPDGYTIVVIGVVDPGIHPLVLARSVRELDSPSYEAATTNQPPAGLGDGCATLFC